MSDWLASIPAARPPPGRIPNFNNPESRANEAIITTAASLGLMLIFVSLRMYRKVRQHQSFNGSDYACVIATVLSISLSAVFLNVLNGPAAEHVWEVRITSFKSSEFKQSLYGNVAYSAAILFTKQSLFLLYLRVFSADVRSRYLIYSGLGFTSIFYPVVIVYLLAVCTPRHGESWFESWSSSRCRSTTKLMYIQGGVNILSDFYLLSLPIAVVWNLQLPLRKKVGLSAIFMMGILACICSILNLYYRVHLEKTQDMTWDTIPMDITSVVEVNVGIICGCMPLLASMLDVLLDFMKIIRSHLSSLTSKCYHYFTHFGECGSNPAKRIDPYPVGGFYLETQLLGSVQGNGVFFGSTTCPQNHEPFSTTSSSEYQGQETSRNTLD